MQSPLAAIRGPHMGHPLSRTNLNRQYPHSQMDAPRRPNWDSQKLTVHPQVCTCSTTLHCRYIPLRGDILTICPHEIDLLLVAVHGFAEVSRVRSARLLHALMAVDCHSLIATVFGGESPGYVAYLLFVDAVTPTDILHVASAIVTVMTVWPGAVGPHAAV